MNRGKKEERLALLLALKPLCKAVLMAYMNLKQRCCCMILTVTFNSDIAQLVEQVTVNHWVAGSSPAVGAKFESLTRGGEAR